MSVLTFLSNARFLDTGSLSHCPNKPVMEMMPDSKVLSLILGPWFPFPGLFHPPAWQCLDPFKKNKSLRVGSREPSRDPTRRLLPLSKGSGTGADPRPQKEFFLIFTGTLLFQKGIQKVTEERGSSLGSAPVPELYTAPRVPFLGNV